MSNTSTNVAAPLDREWPIVWADDELRLQWEFLTFLRITVVNKIAGLTPAQAAATPLPTSPLLSLTGIVKHLISVERWWLSIVGGASDLPDLWADGDPDTGEYTITNVRYSQYRRTEKDKLRSRLTRGGSYPSNGR